MAFWRDASLTKLGRVGEIVHEKGSPKTYSGHNYAYYGGAYTKVVFGRGYSHAYRASGVGAGAGSIERN